MDFPGCFDVIVVGGGHAGTEASLAAARMGAKTLLLSHDIETLGQMSCNPAIGGIGKSHLVKEIDALDGAMGLASDRAGIQFRTLNSSKGPAVRATRAQTDRVLYKAAIRHQLENQKNLWLFQQSAEDLIIENGNARGVITQIGIRFNSKTVVLTVGTFLDGVIHIGLKNHSGGRAGNLPSIGLAQKLRALPFRVSRLKTGTPPRVDARSVDFSLMQMQPSDNKLPVMSYIGNREMHPRQIECFITYTNERTHDIVRAEMHRSPVYTGVIKGVGPRYCPSIEDKIVRFTNKSSHQIFIEPEGLTTHELYPNGISTSLSFDVQIELIHSIKGMENAHIIRPGYAIEYDYFNPQDLKHSLETKYMPGLFFAGQINGTTGYEEAGAQGLLAGLNAALLTQDKEAWTPRRDEAYLGVMVDDLISIGTKEPYRMFTSRAEYRLILREDNADMRLTEKGHELGLISDERWVAFCKKREAIELETQRLKSSWIIPNSPEAEKINPKLETPINHEYNLLDLLKRPGVMYADITNLKNAPDKVLDEQVSEQIQIAVKYAGYINRQAEDIERLRRQENTALPSDLEYSKIEGLSSEIKQKLTQACPTTLAAASRIQGVTPAAVSLLLIHLKKRGIAAGRSS